MAYKPPWPAFQYTQPDTSQPAPQNSQLMDYYTSYGFGPEQQFFDWRELYDPASLGRVREGWGGQPAQFAGMGQVAQTQDPAANTSWWTDGTQNNAYAGWPEYDRQYNRN